MKSYNNQLAVQINQNGFITDVLFNSFQDIPVSIGTSVVHLFSDLSTQVFYEHFSHIQNEMFTFGFQAIFHNRENVFVFMFKTEQVITFFAISMEKEVMSLFDEVIKINNEQVQSIRSLYKKISKSDEYGLFEEIMKVNNALINTRRELGQKNQELKRLNQTLEMINFTDYLTQIFNRRKFFLDIYELVQKEEYYLTMMDFNNFKVINDKYGHHRGDEALRYFSNRMTEEIAYFNGIMYRLGGDEFACLIPSNQSIDFQSLFEKIDSELKQFDETSSISFGTVVVNRDNCNKEIKAEVSMHQADLIMYDKKSKYYETLHKKVN